jgi:hypothetical protein
VGKQRGLPPGFDLDVPQSVREAPVQLGDYLDEVDSAPPLPRPAPPAKRPDTSAKVIEMPRAPEPPMREPEGEESGAEKPVLRTRRKKQRLPQRKQINATPETLRMIEELIDHVQRYSVQKDAKASEVFHALVLALYEAREHIDLSDVPARGRWGSPTAKSFPTSLKNAFQEAIAAVFKKNRR